MEGETERERERYTRQYTVKPSFPSWRAQSGPALLWCCDPVVSVVLWCAKCKNMKTHSNENEVL